jgi:hypothetical protein
MTGWFDSSGFGSLPPAAQVRSDGDTTFLAGSVIKGLLGDGRLVWARAEPVKYSMGQARPL